MSKFNHNFKLSESGDSYAVYESENNLARLDFISNTCVRVAIYKSGEDMLPTFAVNPNNVFSFDGRNRLSTDGFEMCTSEKIFDDVHTFTLSKELTVEVEPHNFLLSFKTNGNVLFSDRKPLAYNFENEFGHGQYHYVSRMKNEKIFGLGDKSGKLDKSGRSFRIETSDSMGYNAESSDPLYKHVTFYICENEVGSYGIFYDTSDDSYFNFGEEINNYYEPYKYFKTQDNCLVYYVFVGSKLSVLKQFASICGKQPLPPKWTFDYCASTMAYTDAPDSQKKMDEFIEHLKQYNLSCGGFYLSSGYTSIGEKRCVFNWNNDKFPNVNKFISDFSGNGIEIIPNIKPAFLTEHPMYKAIAEKGYFIKNPDGSPFVTEFWDGLGSYLDFTNKAAYDFWGEKVTETLLDYGVNATWNDNNEFDIKDCDAVADGFFENKIKANRLKPVLTYLMVASSYSAQMKKNPAIRPFLSTRSGGIGVRRFAQTWSGDNMTSFSDLRYCHYIGLTMSLSGFYFYGHDLGGFSGNMPSRELFLRWIQHGVFEPRMTIHSWNSDGTATMPWSYPESMDSVRALFAERKRLLPYIYNCAYEAVENEEPINAPVFMYYDDEQLYSYPDTMMLGRNILAAFCFDEGKDIAKAYLPKGNNWYLGDEIYNGGREVSVKISPTDVMPYFVKSGCVLPTDEADYGFHCKEKIVFTVYPKESGSFKDSFFSDDGNSFEYKDNNCVHLLFDVECTNSEVTVTYSNNGNESPIPDIKLCSADRRKLIVNKA